MAYFGSTLKNGHQFNWHPWSSSRIGTDYQWYLFNFTKQFDCCMTRCKCWQKLTPEISGANVCTMKKLSCSFLIAISDNSLHYFGLFSHPSFQRANSYAASPDIHKLLLWYQLLSVIIDSQTWTIGSLFSCCLCGWDYKLSRGEIWAKCFLHVRQKLLMKLMQAFGHKSVVCLMAYSLLHNYIHSTHTQLMHTSLQMQLFIYRTTGAEVKWHERVQHLLKIAFFLESINFACYGFPKLKALIVWRGNC